MNAVDATDREAQVDNGVPASLLTIILDTNPHAWALLTDELPLSKVVANLLVFINAHLAISNANRVAVIASHVQRAQWLYPSPILPASAGYDHTNGGSPGIGRHVPVQAPSSDDPNKYRPFAHIEHTLNSNLRTLIASTVAGDLKDTPATMMAGALTMALSYISKATLSAGPSSGSGPSYSTTAAAGNFTEPNAPSGDTAPSSQGLTSRILIVSVSGDLSHQYIPMMNAIFACQRLHCPIDILKLAGDTVFLQQAADATGGIYTSLAPDSEKPAIDDGGDDDDDSSGRARPPRRKKTAGILQYLLLAYLADPSARKLLNAPGQSHGVDFRAACFCHRRVVDVGYVCSVCLSIFCDPGVMGEDQACLTCGTALRIAGFGVAPVVVGGGPRRNNKKKKGKGVAGRRDGASGGESSAVATPG